MLLDSLLNVLEKKTACGSTTLWSTSGISLVPLPDADDDRHVFECRASKPGEKAVIAISRPLGNISMFWKVGMRSGEPPMPADWSGKIPVSLANSAPMGCLLDGSDRNVLSYAYSFAEGEVDMRYGVDEEHALFTIVLEIERMPTGSRLLLIEGNERIEDVVKELATWIDPGRDSFPVAVEAAEPVFSTWYAYLQRVSELDLAEQTKKIADLGCKSVFIDDGWQEFGHGRGYEGCGDWIADASKFPDMAATVKRFRQAGLSTVLWIAPLLLGRQSNIFPELAKYAPIYNGDFGSHYYVLDPRRRTVRDHITSVCHRLVGDYGISGLKIDFLDTARVYQGVALENPEPGDIADVGEAMRLMLDQIRSTLIDTCEQTPIVEFRQPYSSPAIAPYSNVVRASDCPSDCVTNRIRIIDERMLAVNRIVHGDMLLWDTSDPSPTACAEQLMGSFFGVPQISVRPMEMSSEQFDTCRFLLRVWGKYRDVILNGRLHPVSVSGGYPLIHMYRDDIQLSGVYGPNLIVDVDYSVVRRIVVLNASHEDSITLRIVGWRGESLRVTAASRDCTGRLMDTWDDKVIEYPGTRLGSPTGEEDTFITVPCPHGGVVELTI